MTQIEAARNGQLTSEMKKVASLEKMDPKLFQKRLAKGEIALLKNKNHNLDMPVGVGTGLKTKVNANIGTSTDASNVELEIEKAKVAVAAGADAIMDLSTGGNLSDIRKRIMDEVPVVIGTVPIYEAAVQISSKKGGLIHMTADDLFDVLERQAEEGVDFFTVHCGITQNSLERLKKQGRLTDIVSRGGSFLVTWMVANNAENPLYEQYDRVLEIAKEYDVCLSLGDGMRPGSIADATDRAQIQELLTLGELTQTAWDNDVQIMIEGPGHVPLDQIKTNIQLEKKICQNAPFYVLGPLVTDVAPGYDHITSAIGGAIAASEGADFLCYVTPGEHLKLPDLEDVRQGVIGTRIAAHAADIVKGVPGAAEWDYNMSKARKALDWDKQAELAMDSELVKKVRKQITLQEDDVCSMCGEFCAMKLVDEALERK